MGITLVSLLSSYYEALGEKRGLRRDLQRRAEVLGESLAGNVERDLEKASAKDLQHTVQHFANREHLAGLAVYDRQGNLLAVTPELASPLRTIPPKCLKPCAKTMEKAISDSWCCLVAHPCPTSASARRGDWRPGDRSRREIHPGRESSGFGEKHFCGCWRTSF